LEDLAKEFAVYVNRELPDVRKFDVVAFSMGGLLTRFYLQHGGAKRVRKLVTISSPNRGTLVAWLLWNDAGKQMRPHSDFLNSLNSDLGCYRTIPWLTIRTPFDLTIVPSSNTEMPVAVNTKTVVLAHPLMISNDRVVQQVFEFLNSTQ
jgi:triacylglycerol lipase